MKKILGMLGVFIFLGSTFLFAQGVAPDVQAKIDAQVKLVQAWGSDAKFVDAVKAYNAAPSAESKAMTQEKWATLTLLDPFVRSFSKSALGEHLKTLKTDAISEIFVSGADGCKVAFLSKTSNWSHLGKAKHDQPMAGKIWQGAVELDASSGVQQIQVGVPVLDGGKAIGSIVVGLNIAKLK